MRKVLGVAGACAAIAASGAAGTAAAATGAGPGTGDPFWTLETLSTGASSNPDVLVNPDGSALAVFDNFTVPSGTFHVCQVPFAATACARITNVVPTDEATNDPLLVRNAAGQLLLANGTANYTELFTSLDDGATFGPAVRVSRYANADGILPLADGTLLILGSGNDDDANAAHVVHVPADGSGIDTQGWRFPGDISSRGIAFNGGRYVVASSAFLSTGSSQARINYAVFSGIGDPNVQANWTQGTLDVDSTDGLNLADGPSGVVLVTVDDDGDVVASKLSGTTFGPLKQIGDKKGTAYLPNVSQDATGRVTAVWQVNDVGLRSSTSLDGVSWSAPRTLNPDREFDTDVGTATNGTGLAVTRANGSYQATRVYAGVTLKLAPQSETIVKGDGMELVATLTDEKGDPIGNAKITLRSGKNTIGNAKTSSAGVAAFDVEPKKTKKYRAFYDGTEVLASFESAKATVKVKKPKKKPKKKG